MKEIYCERENKTKLQKVSLEASEFYCIMMLMRVKTEKHNCMQTEDMTSANVCESESEEGV